MQERLSSITWHVTQTRRLSANVLGTHAQRGQRLYAWLCPPVHPGLLQAPRCSLDITKVCTPAKRSVLNLQRMRAQWPRSLQHMHMLRTPCERAPAAAAVCS